MTSLRRLFIGVASLVAGAASVGATTITGQIVLAQSGAFTAMTATSGAVSQTVSVNKFDATAVQTALTASCTSGHTCSNVTLTAINLTLTASVTNSLTATNTNSTSKNVLAGWAVIGDLTLDLAGSTGVGLAYDETVPTLNGTSQFTVAAKSGAVNGTITKSTGSSGVTNTFGIAPYVPSGSTSTNYYGSGTVASSVAGKASVNVNSPYAVTTNEFYNPTGVTSGATNLNNRNLGTSLFNSDFIGSGSTSYTLGLTSTLKSPTITSGVSFAAQSALAAGGNVQIQYVYSYDDTVNAAVPEPTSMALFGSALVGIGLLRRRSRRS